MEVSPFNSKARRVAGGIWNAHVLPMMEWGIAEQRVVLPAALQASLGFTTPVLRWRRSKYEQVVIDQPIEKRILSDLSGYLNHWERVGIVPGKSATWRVFFGGMDDWQWW